MIDTAAMRACVPPDANSVLLTPQGFLELLDELDRLREQLAAADESRRLAQEKIDKLRASVAELESAR